MKDTTLAVVLLLVFIAGAAAIAYAVFSRTGEAMTDAAAAGAQSARTQLDAGRSTAREDYEIHEPDDEALRAIPSAAEQLARLIIIAEHRDNVLRIALRNPTDNPLPLTFDPGADSLVIRHRGANHPIDLALLFELDALTLNPGERSLTIELPAADIDAERALIVFRRTPRTDDDPNARPVEVRTPIAQRASD